MFSWAKKHSQNTKELILTIIFGSPKKVINAQDIEIYFDNKIVGFKRISTQSKILDQQEKKSILARNA
jgi:hypothetical protein